MTVPYRTALCSCSFYTTPKAAPHHDSSIPHRTLLLLILYRSQHGGVNVDPPPNEIRLTNSLNELKIRLTFHEIRLTFYEIRLTFNEIRSTNYLAQKSLTNSVKRLTNSLNEFVENR